MIPLFDRAAVRALDREAIDSLGLSGLVLMENAGHGAARVVLERFGDSLKRVVLLGGPGNNGGDAWVVARHWTAAGVRPVAVLVGEEARMSADARANWEVLKRLGAYTRVVSPSSIDEVRRLLADATLAVDGLFGTGLDRPLTGGYEAIVRCFDKCPGRKVALDLPSGIDADTGAVLGAACKVDLTVTFGAHKKGLLQFPAADYVGELALVGIGGAAPEGADSYWLEAEDLASKIRPRAADVHKGGAGHVLVVGGAPGRSGAAFLAGLGALRSGAGLVTVCTPVAAALPSGAVELMTMALPSTERELLESIDCRTAAILGPGLGFEQRDLVMGAVLNAKPPCVLDADALNLVAEEGLEILKGASGTRVLTPHPGEAGRLLGSSAADVQADRYGAAREIAERTAQIVVLKGAGTIIEGASRRFVCTHGTPALAVAGTGDVLAGVVGAMLCTLEPLPAATAGVLLHALAGEAAAVGDRGLLASELANALPGCIARALREPSRSLLTA